jgi:hypothetical protein
MPVPPKVTPFQAKIRRDDNLLTGRRPDDRAVIANAHPDLTHPPACGCAADRLDQGKFPVTST